MKAEGYSVWDPQKWPKNFSYYFSSIAKQANFTSSLLDISLTICCLRQLFIPSRLLFGQLIGNLEVLKEYTLWIYQKVCTSERWTWCTICINSREAVVWTDGFAFKGLCKNFFLVGRWKGSKTTDSSCHTIMLDFYTKTSSLSFHFPGSKALPCGAGWVLNCSSL